MTRQCEGKVALVTGGNSGIGKATAMRFAQEGARVVIAARRVDEGVQTVEEIGNSGGEAIFVKTDVAQAADVKAVVDKTVATYGRLDYAFNNAGVAKGGLLHESTEEDWDLVLDINLEGVWLCMKYQIAQMLKQGGGAIVNDSSVGGLTGFVRSPTYAASKHGVIGLSKSAALQYIKQGIRINVVCPGVTMTPLIEGAFAKSREAEEWYLGKQPTGQAASPDQVAQAVVWLCSDAASLITGVALPVDGGLLAGMW